MNFESLEEIKKAGFEGFVPILDLLQQGYKAIPRVPGVYFILRNNPVPPTYLKISPAYWLDGKDPTEPFSILEQNWVDGAIVIYIGKAGNIEGKTTLRERLKSYMHFGIGKKARHRGGKYIWQLKDSEELLVCWKQIVDEEPVNVETRLIRDFKEQHNGKRPFANRKD